MNPALPPLDLDPELVAWLAVAGPVVGALGLLVALVAHLRLRRLRRRLRAGDGPARRAAAAGSAPEVAGPDGVAGAVRHVHVVRYDAWSDSGGRLSFSAALLDDAGDGMVLTAINGRAEGRAYAKNVRAGRAVEQPLSPEEEQAVRAALEGAEPVPLDVPDGRRGGRRVGRRTTGG